MARDVNEFKHQPEEHTPMTAQPHSLGHIPQASNKETTLHTTPTYNELATFDATRLSVRHRSDWHRIERAVREVLDVADYDTAAAILTGLAQNLGHRDYCELCATSGISRTDAVVLPVAAQESPNGVGLQCAYLCGRCGHRWSTGWVGRGASWPASEEVAE